LPHFSPDGTKLLYSKYLTGTYGVPGAVIDVFAYDFRTTNCAPCARSRSPVEERSVGVGGDHSDSTAAMVGAAYVLSL
jgi:hypothetical protein